MAELLEKMIDARKDVPRAFVKKLLSAFKLMRIAKHHDGLLEPLSERELEVLRFIAAGLPNKKITEQLFISMSTVKTHLRNIYGKLDVHSRTEAVAKAMDLGILPPKII
jgi:LuxR family maltose regulon positive regulatory protein